MNPATAAIKLAMLTAPAELSPRLTIAPLGVVPEEAAGAALPVDAAVPVLVFTVEKPLPDGGLTPPETPGAPPAAVGKLVGAGMTPEAPPVAGDDAPEGAAPLAPPEGLAAPFLAAF